MTSNVTSDKLQRRTRATKAARREQLVEATLAVIARNGLNAVKLADISDLAGLSRGIVNFHFESKDNLLLAALRHLSQEYDENWRRELAAVTGGAAAEMRTLTLADLSEAVCSPSKLAAWFGFFGAAASRPEYLDLCWAQDEAYLEVLIRICAALDREGGYGHDPAQTATAFCAMQEGLWLRLMLGNAELSREDALTTALGMLGTLFPRHFSPSGDLLD